MKTSLWLFAVFVYVFAALVCVGAAAYMVYFDCARLVAGLENAVFSFPLFLEGIVFFAPFAALSACLCVIFFLIRHPSNSALSFAVYALICAFVWLAVIPFCAKAGERFFAAPVAEYTDLTLSPGYFRQVGGKIFYFAGYSEDGTPFGICCSLRNGSAADIKDYTVSVCDDISAEADYHSRYADPLIGSTVRFSPSFDLFVRCLRSFRDMTREALHSPPASCLRFASIALAFFSLIGLKRVSSWRLINLSLIIAGFLFIWAGNVCLYSSEYGTRIITVLANRGGSFFAEPFAASCVLNGMTALVCMLIGIINFCRKSDPNQWGAA